jgi:hypothetical protein
LRHVRSLSFTPFGGLRRPVKSDSSPVFFSPSYRWDSRIAVSLPSLFDGVKFPRLLYRGTRDGFSSADFHRHCDRQGGTLTLIRSHTGAVFGGYTRIPWDSKSGHKTDKFSVHSEKPARYDTDAVSTQFSAHGIMGHRLVGTIPTLRTSASETSGHCYQFGNTYQNNPGLPGKTFLTGVSEFLVAEIEVFLIGD